jgi:hypothetical protein
VSWGFAFEFLTWDTRFKPAPGGMHEPAGQEVGFWLASARGGHLPFGLNRDLQSSRP